MSQYKDSSKYVKEKDLKFSQFHLLQKKFTTEKNSFPHFSVVDYYPSLNAIPFSIIHNQTNRLDCHQPFSTSVALAHNWLHFIVYSNSMK